MRDAGIIAAFVLAACGSSPDPSSPPASIASADPPRTPAAPSANLAVPPSSFTCSGKTAGAGDSTLTLPSGRTVLLHVPKSYDPGKGTMLVLNFHGFQSDAWQEVLLTKMNDASDARGFVVGYPVGLGQSWNAGDCCGSSLANKVDDVAFVKEVLAKVEGDYCVDPKRIYATGMSNGGFFTHRLGCEMATTFAAIAPVAGVLGEKPEDCKPPRSVPLIDFHGTGDPIVPYTGGTPVSPVPLGAGTEFRSVPHTIDAWRAIDRCADPPASVYQNGDASCTRWTCDAGSHVELCIVTDGGHTWPGGLDYPVLGKTSHDIDATNTIIDFFVAHPMP